MNHGLWIMDHGYRETYPAMTSGETGLLHGLLNELFRGTLLGSVYNYPPLKLSESLERNPTLFVTPH